MSFSVSLDSAIVSVLARSATASFKENEDKVSTVHREIVPARTNTRNIFWCRHLWDIPRVLLVGKAARVDGSSAVIWPMDPIVKVLSDQKRG